jgi:hypothetical protein
MSDIINSDFFEAMLRQAVIKNNKDEIAAIPSDEVLAKKYEFSERHKNRMKKLFAADERREVFTIVYRWSKVAVVAVCISATLMFSVLLTSAEVRKVIGDVIVTWFEQFTKFQSSETSNEFIERDWLPTYLPEEFTLYNAFEAGEIKDFEYRNSDNARIVFNFMPSDFSTSIDNEDMEYSVIVENDIVYHLFQTTITDGYHDNVVVWDIAGYRLTILGNYDIDELIKIALSIK